MNYRQEWAEGGIEAGTLLDAIEELQKEVEFLKDRLTIRVAEHIEILSLLIETEVETERFREVLKEIVEYPSNDAIEMRRVAKYSLENPNV